MRHWNGIVPFPISLQNSDCKNAGVTHATGFMWLMGLPRGLFLVMLIISFLVGMKRMRVGVLFLRVYKRNINGEIGEKKGLPNAEFKWNNIKIFLFSLSQPKYAENLKCINLRAFRKKDRNAPTEESEKTQLRALLGGVSWHAQQVTPYFSAEVGLLLSEVNKSTLETITRLTGYLTKSKI